MYRLAANFASKARVAKICSQQFCATDWCRLVEDWDGAETIQQRMLNSLMLRGVEELSEAVKVTMGPKDGKTLFNELEVVEGMKLDRGYISPYFITNTKTQKCELENPLILIHEKKISNFNSLVKALEIALKSHRPLLIVSEDVESEVLATLIVNKLRVGLKVCAIKAPGFGENRKTALEDLAVITRGQVITEELGLNLEKLDTDWLGSCKKVTVSKDDTIILDGAGDKKAIEERSEQIRAAVETSTSDYDKEKLKKRLAKLSGGVAVLKTPAHTIAANAGVEGAVVVSLTFMYGTGEYVDLVKAGIIDPLKVIRTALVDAARPILNHIYRSMTHSDDERSVESVSSLLTTTEAIIVDLARDEVPAAGGE